MKKILYFHHAIGDGGAPRSLSLLMSGLRDSEFSATVVMPDRPGSGLIADMFCETGAKVILEKDIRPFHGSEVARADTMKERAYAALSYRSLVSAAKRLVQHIEPDIVHLNSTCLVGAGKGAHLANDDLPVIAHVREPLLQNWWGIMLAGMNRRHVDHFISIDNAGLDSIGIYKPSNTDVIRNFVDPTVFHPCEDSRLKKRKELGWTENETVFLSLSRVEAFNGAANLAELVTSVSENLAPAARFVLAGFYGKSSYEQHTRSLIQKSDRCSAISFDPDPASLINAADVIIAPFISPHSARSVFEGSATGKPAIVSDLPNLTELIVEGKTGFAFRYHQPDSFISAVNSLCDQPKRTAFGNAALKFAEENFFLQANVGKTLDVYRNLIIKSRLND